MLDNSKYLDFISNIVGNFGIHSSELSDSLNDLRNMNTKTINSNNSTLKISNTTINGDNNDIIGNNNTITGNNNDVEGNNNIVTGNNSDVIGDYNTVTGNNCDVEGYKCVVRGNNVDYSPTNRPKHSKKPEVGNLGTNEFSVMGSRSGKTYKGSTPMDAIDLMKVGEDAYYEQEQRKLDLVAKKNLEDLKYEEKVNSRKWVIDNVNLSDEEYEEVAEYMESIKDLWQIW